MSCWVSGSLRMCSFLLFDLGAAACRVDRARRGNVCLQDQAKACSPTDQPVRRFKDGLGTNMTMKTFFIYISHHVRSMSSCEKHGVASPPWGASSGGHDSCQPARSAATYTSSRGGARCHGAALSVSKFQRGAARQSTATSKAGFLLNFSSAALETKAESEPPTILS